jgi:PncC family amidohydrolase
MSLNGKFLESLLEFQIGELLRRRNLKLAMVESCTGGLIGHRITNIPGSSDYFLGSLVAYAYEAKERLVGVKHETLMTYGAVSKETALELAHGVRQVLSPDFGMEHIVGLSITGIAGPGGGLPGKPVGLAWVGLSTPSGEQAYKILTQGNRQENKAIFAEQALMILNNYLEGTLFPES